MLSDASASRPAAGKPRDFTKSDTELYDSIMDELAGRSGATEHDRRLVISLVRCKRSETDWRDTARMLRAQMKVKPGEIAELIKLAKGAEDTANKLSGEARAIARSLRIDAETRSGKAAATMKAKVLEIDPWEASDE